MQTQVMHDTRSTATMSTCTYAKLTAVQYICKMYAVQWNPAYFKGGSTAYSYGSCVQGMWGEDKIGGKKKAGGTSGIEAGREV